MAATTTQFSRSVTSFEWGAGVGTGVTDGDKGEIVVSGTGTTWKMDLAGMPAASSVPMSTVLAGYTGAQNEGITLAQIMAAFGAANVVFTNTSISLTRAAHAGKVIVCDTSSGAITLTLAQNATSGFQLYDSLPLIVKVGTTPANQVTVTVTGSAAFENNTGMLTATTANCPALGFYQGRADKWIPTVPAGSSSGGVTTYQVNDITWAAGASTADLVVTGSNISIPYSAIGPNGWIECYVVFRRTVGAGTLATKARITTGAGATLSGTTAQGGASGVVNGPFGFFFNRGGAALNSASSASGSVNTTIDTSGGITVQLLATQSDATTTHVIDKFIVRVNYGA